MDIRIDGQTVWLTQQQMAPFFYNLSMIIAVGYRLRSKQGKMFRQWATKRLEEYRDGNS